jgi:ankyrin repeat protein
VLLRDSVPEFEADDASEKSIVMASDQLGAAPLWSTQDYSRYLLQFHPDVTIADHRGNTPLDNAMRMGKENSALLLLEAQPPAQRTPQFFARAMETAIRMDQASLIAALLRQGINDALPSGYTALDAAAFAGASKVARMLLDNGADPNLAGKDGTTPLEDAARQRIRFHSRYASCSRGRCESGE